MRNWRHCTILTKGPKKYFKHLQDTQTVVRNLGGIYDVPNMRLDALSAYFGKSSAAFSKLMKNWKDDKEKLLKQPNFAKTVYPACKKYWLNKLVRLHCCAPIHRYLVELVVDIAVTSARQSQLERTITGLQTQLAILEQRAAEQPQKPPPDEASVMSALTSPTSIQAFKAATRCTTPTATATTVTTTSPCGACQGGRNIGRNTNHKQWRKDYVGRIKKKYGEKGYPYNQYCWSRGLTHNHKSGWCQDLTADEKEKYQHASLSNTMGGSNKIFDCLGKYEADYDPSF